MADDLVKRFSAKHRSWITASALAALSAAFTTGCAIPIVKSTPSPKVESQLPTDLRASGDKVLVIKQGSSSSASQVLYASDVKGSGAVVTADFVKGSELTSFSEALKLQSDVGLMIVVPIPVAPILLGGAVSSEKLEKLCVITPNGRQIRLSAGPAASEPHLLSMSRRDAIVSALRGGGNYPFDRVDGPCGVLGMVEWPAELRSRVIEFLLGVPAVATDTEVNQHLAAGLRNSWTADGTKLGTAGAMLLISANYRSVAIAERPRFLAADQFGRLDSIVGSLGVDAIIGLLPPYASGAYDRSNVTLQSFCLISSDGRAKWMSRGRWSSTEPASWETLDDNPPLRYWKVAAVAALRSGSEALDSDVGCVPSNTDSWSEADRAAAGSFLQSIREPGATDAHASLSEVNTVSAAGAMVLAVTSSAEKRSVVVPLLLAPDEVTTIAKAIRLLRPEEFMDSLSKNAGARQLPLEHQRLNYVCIVASDGTMLVFESAGARGWKPPRYLPLSARFLRDAITAIDDRSNYRGSFVCSLEESSQWPADVSANVIGFLEKVRKR